MTGRGMRRRGLGHASAAADCLVPHSLAQHSPPRRPTARSQMPTACPWDGYVRRYVSEAIVPPPRRAAAEPPLPGGEKRKGRRPVVAANVRLPRASRRHPGPANAHGSPVGSFPSPLPALAVPGILPRRYVRGYARSSPRKDSGADRPESPVDQPRFFDDVRAPRVPKRDSAVQADGLHPQGQTHRQALQPQARIFDSAERRDSEPPAGSRSTAKPLAGINRRQTADGRVDLFARQGQGAPVDEVVARRWLQDSA